MSAREPVTSTRPATLSVGIWIESVPDVDLRGEGIARTLAAVLRALVARSDTRVVVALAKWSEAGFQSLLDDWQVPAGKITILVSRSRDPLAIRLRRRGRRRRPLRGRLAVFARRGLKTAPLRWAIRRIAGIASFPAAVALACLAALIGLATLPVLALVWLVVAIGKWLVRAARRITSAVTSRLGIDPARVQQRLGDALLENEFSLLARRANRDANVDVWFVPYPGAAFAGALNAPMVVAVPDLVYVDFPTLFPPAWAERIDRRAKQLVTRARAVITYSRDVAERHVAGHLGIPADRIHVIPHAPFEARATLDAAVEIRGDDRAGAAERIIRGFLRRAVLREGWSEARLDYLRGLPFGEIPFLFVPSQVRPNKNYLNLFRAFERLLRRRHRNLKLVITGAFGWTQHADLQQYVDGARLDLDILSVPNLPSPVHAAFMHLAVLTVVPTLFEGGFPFPFSESLSVGTPVVMSDIRVTREVVPPDLQPVMLFDPYDVEGIADRIAWALDHRSVLLARQRPFQAALQRRTWHDVASEYRATLITAAGDSGRAPERSRRTNSARE